MMPVNVAAVSGEIDRPSTSGCTSVRWPSRMSARTALGWIKETMRGVHVGFGILLPDMDPPSKLHVALGVLLDGLG